MKKLTLTLLTVAVLLLSSCGGAYNKVKCYQSVSDYFPDAQTIFISPDSKYSFIVLDVDSTVWFVVTDDMKSPDVTSTLKIQDLGR